MVISRKNIIRFFYQMVRSFIKNDLSGLATSLTYRLLFSFFPFLIFLLTVFAYFEMDQSALFREMTNVLPTQLMDLVVVFVEELNLGKSGSVLSASLAVSIYSSASGIMALMKGINRVYNQKENRHFVKRWLVAFLMVFLLTIAILVSMLMLVFGDAIVEFLSHRIHYPIIMDFFYGLAGNLIFMFILLGIFLLLYRIGSCEKHSLWNLLPGAFVGLLIWLLASKGFNIYIASFSRYTKVYGSIGSILIVLLWLNLISLAILTGAQINAVLDTTMEDLKQH